MLTGRKAISYNFEQQLIFYHSRLADEPTSLKIESLQFLWFLSNVANSVETKVIHKMENGRRDLWSD